MDRATAAASRRMGADEYSRRRAQRARKPEGRPSERGVSGGERPLTLNVLRERALDALEHLRGLHGERELALLVVLDELVPDRGELALHRRVFARVDQLHEALNGRGH